MNVFDAATTFPLGDASLDNMSGASPMVVQNMLNLPQRTTGCWEGVAWETGDTSSPQHQQWTSGSSGSFVNCFMPTSPRYESRVAVSSPTVAEMNSVHGTPLPRPAAESYSVAPPGSRVAPPPTRAGGGTSTTHHCLDDSAEKEHHQLDTAVSPPRGYHSNATSWYSATGPLADSPNANKVCMVSHPIANNPSKLHSRGVSQHTLSPPVQPAAPNTASTATGQLYRPIPGAPCGVVGSNGGDRNRLPSSKASAGGVSVSSTAISNKKILINEGMTTTADTNTATITATFPSPSTSRGIDADAGFQLHSQQPGATTGHNANGPRTHMTTNVLQTGGAGHSTLLICSTAQNERGATQGQDSQNINTNIIQGSQTNEVNISGSTGSCGTAAAPLHDSISVIKQQSAELCIPSTLMYSDKRGSLESSPKSSAEGNDSFSGAGGDGGVPSTHTAVLQQHYATGDSQEMMSKLQSTTTTTTVATDNAVSSSTVTGGGGYTQQQLLEHSCSSGGVYSASSGEDELPSNTGGVNRSYSGQSANPINHSSQSAPDRPDGIPICLTQDARLTVLVNPRQHSRILKRRLQRQKFRQRELAREFMRPHDLQCNAGLQDKAYIHESRHLHAKRRPRGPGGRFLPTNKPKTRHVE